LLTVLAGVALLAAALMRLGRYVRFVSHSVMLGFLTGIGVNIVLSQIPDMLGVSASGRVALTKAINALANLSEIQLASLLTGVGALA
jgi:SulP family sulfate permease